MSDPVSVDVVIPTYDNASELKACLESLPADRPRLRALVCVDGSTDGTLEYLAGAAFPFPIVVLEHPDRSNRGRSAARNLALPTLTAEVVLLLDADCRLTAGSLDRHVELLERRDCVSVGDVVYENAASNLWARYLRTRGKNRAAAGSELRPLDFNTGNAAMRTADLRALQGFDERFTGWGGEDTELGIRIAEVLRRPLVFNPAARAVSTQQKSVAEGLEQLHRFGRRGLRTLRATHPTGPAPFWIDRWDSSRPRDRALRFLLNPVSDRLVDLLLPIAPFAIQRQLLNYKVIRAVFSGYGEGRQGR